MAHAFSTKEYYEGLLKDPIVRKNFKERHGYDLDTENVATNAGADKMVAMVELTYDDVLENILNTVWWNENVNIKNFLKYDSDLKVRWFGLKDGDEFVAYCGLQIDSEIQVDDKVFPAFGIAYVWAKSGHRYGVKLIERIVEFFEKAENRGDKKAFQFIADPTAKVSLVANFLRSFNEQTGWKVLPVRNEFWESVLFVKEFDRS